MVKSGRRTHIGKCMDSLSVTLVRLRVQGTVEKIYKPGIREI